MSLKLQESWVISGKQPSGKQLLQIYLLYNSLYPVENCASWFTSKNDRIYYHACMAVSIGIMLYSTRFPHPDTYCTTTEEVISTLKEEAERFRKFEY